MTLQVHEFQGYEGGNFRISLTYDAPDAKGKTSAHTDTYQGQFVELVPDEKIVEEEEFETSDPAMRGLMTITTMLEETAEGTLLVATHAGLPEGVSPEDNETGWRMALEKLSVLVEAA
jgi:uncharacterized protein YndB with AHSA1/START domain